MRRARPLLPLAIGFAAGVALPGSIAPFPAIGTVAAAALFPPLAPAGFAVLGHAVAASARAPSTPAPPEGEVRVEGTVVSLPDRSDERARYRLREPSGRVLEVLSPEPGWPLAPGDRVALFARLRPFQPPLNPGGRDDAARARARGVALLALAWTPPVRFAPPSPLAGLDAARLRFGAAASAHLPAREAALVRAIGAGDRSAVDAATNEAFARSGLAHLLSVSGLHLAVVAAGLYAALRALLSRSAWLAERADPRRLAAAGALPTAILYALATGGDVPVVRSAVATGAVLLGVLLDRDGDALNTLALAALGLLAADPGALLDVSFQLSFASVIGLALLAGPFRRAVPFTAPPGWKGRAAEALLTGLCASAAATISTAPLVAFHFRRVSLLSVLANLAGIPLGSALTVVAALAALAAGCSPSLATPLLHLSWPLATALLRVNDAFARPAWSVVGLASPGLAGLAVCHGLGFLALAARGRWRWLCAAASLAALLAPGPLRALAARRRAGLEVVFLSVGQGDGAFLRLPDGSAVLVDAGGEASGRYDPGAREVLPFLRDAGVRRVAAAFLSHPHPDHLFGLAGVAAGMPVERLFSNGRPGDEAAARALARLPPAEPLRAGEAWERAGVRFEILGPPTGSEAWSENDASLVLSVRYGATAFLFPGDVEEEAEAALASSGRDLRADVVKVPHHGSRTAASATFAARVRPRWAVASVGVQNRFGFPHAEAVASWTREGARLLRTDEGAVRFFSDGRSVTRTEAARALDLLATPPARL
ncbi:MAG TPA: DNA internalization-related competence protein ComEC/Rec2 [Anaeromyxobacteraceae bacterium]|jgi:competence protein ComEC|nr:DNA internalization-related competence protein ComEC/Rec2 [Anaeromyxobacteraceae bacterium]